MWYCDEKASQIVERLLRVNKKVSKFGLAELVGGKNWKKGI